MFANTIFAIVRWYKEPTICGSNSLRHKIAHLLMIQRLGSCTTNYLRYREQEIHNKIK